LLLALGIVSWTTDFGTESVLSQYELKHIKDMLRFLDSEMESDRPTTLVEEVDDSDDGFAADVQQGHREVAGDAQPGVDANGGEDGDGGFEPDVQQPDGEVARAHVASGARGSGDHDDHGCDSDDSSYGSVDGDEDGWCGFPKDAKTNRVYPYSQQVLGVMHIIHNGLKDAIGKFEHYDLFRVQLATLVAVFSAGEKLEVFTEGCLIGVFAHFKHLFNKCCPTFIDWRWGSLVDVCKWLRIRRNVIICAWKTDVFIASLKKKARQERASGGRAEPDEEAALGAQRSAQGGGDDEYKPVDVKLVELAILNASFWFYLESVLELGRIPQKFVLWVEECVCHPLDRRLDSEASSRDEGRSKEERCRSMIRLQLGDKANATEKERAPLCPMRGMKAPEFARGEWREALESVGKEGQARLMEGAHSFGRRSNSAHVSFAVREATLILGKLSPKSHDICVRNFDATLEFLITVYELKLEYTTDFPFVINGMAAVRERTAIVHAKMLLTRFDSVPTMEGFDDLTRFWFDGNFKENTICVNNLLTRHA